MSTTQTHAALANVGEDRIAVGRFEKDPASWIGLFEQDDGVGGVLFQIARLHFSDGRHHEHGHKSS